MIENERGRGRPRFAQGTELPEVPEGMELYKFYGRPVLIPARADGEDLVGKTTYTQRQLDRLYELRDALALDYDRRSCLRHTGQGYLD